MLHLQLFTCWLGLASCSTAPDQQQQNPEVDTALGKIIGKTVDFEGVSVHTFQSIPYAKPPIGDLRFKKPQPVEKWDEPIVADHLPPGCIQHSSTPFPWLDTLPGKTMDCLYLNVWTPGNAGPHTQKKNVMFFVHGGGFRISSSRVDYYNGVALAALGDVVVVTTNVRLSVEGFLFSGTEDAPGNVGLHDLLTALQWTQTHIGNFGGDKDTLTIFGQSSGAIAIGMLMTSPMADGLFTKAIFQSGSAANLDGEDPQKDFDLSEEVAKAVGCTPGDRTLGGEPKEVVKCLRDTDALELAKTVGKVGHNPQRGLYPRFGDDILPHNARKQIIVGKFKNIPILIGSNTHEGSTMISKAYKQIFGFFGDKADGVNRTVGEDIIRHSFKGFEDVDAVVKKYLGSVDEDEEEKVLEQVQAASGDYARVCPSVYLADSVAKNGNPVYSYYFTHRPSNTPYAPWMGVAHFDETPFVFGYPLRYPSNYTQEEKDLSRKMIGIWTDFAKQGSLEHWPLYSQDHPNYKTLDTDGEEIGTGPHLKYCNFFRPYFGFQ